MNQANMKTENTLADDSERTQPLEQASATATSLDLVDEPSSNEDTDRRLYRRSVAYFFFGFGCNQHSILTDEPTERS